MMRDIRVLLLRGAAWSSESQSALCDLLRVCPGVCSLNLGESFGRISIKPLIEAIESGQNGLVMCFVECSQSD